MAIDKAVDSAILDDGLAAIADAIREKSGTSDSLEFPDAMAAAIGAIPADDGSYKAVVERTATTPALPEDLTTIGSCAFAYCYQLILTSLPSSVTSIKSGAFKQCTKLALTSLPGGLTSIESDAFSYASGLAITSMPRGVTTIGTYAFNRCTNLTSMTFEGTPTSIASNAFNGCTGMATINAPWAEGAVENAPWGATNATINYNYTGA